MKNSVTMPFSGLSGHVAPPFEEEKREEDARKKRKERRKTDFDLLKLPIRRLEHLNK